jgi:hypothetical protein
LLSEVIAITDGVQIELWSTTTAGLLSILLLLVKVVPGNTAETKAAMIGLEKVNEVFDMVQLAWADQGFGGEPLRLWMKQELGWDLEEAHELMRLCARDLAAKAYWLEA